MTPISSSSGPEATGDAPEGARTAPQPATTLVVVTHPKDWPLELPGVEVVRDRDYLTGARFASLRGARVFNLSRSYRYQSAGYYVSLLAAARRQRPFPDLMTVLDMKSRTSVRAVDDELDALIQRGLDGIKSERFTLSIYFGRNLAARHARLAARLFAEFPAPLLRAQFVRGERWRLTSVAVISARDVPEDHTAFLHEAATEYFAKPRFRRRTRAAARYDLAILYDPNESTPPSDARALERFRAAAERQDCAVELIQRSDAGRLREFDALLIRETTRVDDHTFRMAQRAAREGIPVIDDPVSILRCTNKVFLHEALTARGVATPATVIAGEVDADDVQRRIGFPCVVKLPDGAFSRGVRRCADRDEYVREATAMLVESDLIVVQEFAPSEFDWRIGVLEREALYACRYHMARGHWQIADHRPDGRVRFGRAEPVPLDEVPRDVLDAALRAAGAVGDGLYGVDLKALPRGVVVIEVNDNPNIDDGIEDAFLGDRLYDRIVGALLRRVEGKAMETKR